MTEAVVQYVAERILRVQDILGRRLVIENVSTYLMPNAEMSEAEFIREVLQYADCDLLLDVNNVMSTALIMAVMHLGLFGTCQKRESVIYILLDMNKFKKFIN